MDCTYIALFQCSDRIKVLYKWKGWLFCFYLSICSFPTSYDGEMPLQGRRSDAVFNLFFEFKFLLNFSKARCVANLICSSIEEQIAGDRLGTFLSQKHLKKAVNAKEMYTVLQDPTWVKHNKTRKARILVGVIIYSYVVPKPVPSIITFIGCSFSQCTGPFFHLWAFWCLPVS